MNLDERKNVEYSYKFMTNLNDYAHLKLKVNIHDFECVSFKNVIYLFIHSFISLQRHKYK